MLKRLIAFLFTICYLGFSAQATSCCRPGMEPKATMRTMVSGDRRCPGMAAKQSPEKNCCKNICKEINNARTASLVVKQQITSFAKLQPRFRYLQKMQYQPVPERIAIYRPPQTGRSVPLFLRLENFRI